VSAFGVSWFVAGKAFRILKDPVEYQAVQAAERGA
jgi:hypothetical protein